MSALVNQIIKIFDIGESADEFSADYDEFAEELETMYGQELLAVTTNTFTFSNEVGAIKVGTTTVDYITTDYYARTINVKTGEVTKSATTYSATSSN